MLYKHHGEPEIEYPRARTKIKTISSQLKFNKRNRYLINEKLLVAGETMCTNLL